MDKVQIRNIIYKKSIIKKRRKMHMDNLIIVAAAIVVVIVLILITGYVKAPTDTAVIISGLKKEPKYVIGRSSIKIPFL